MGFGVLGDPLAFGEDVEPVNSEVGAGGFAQVGDACRNLGIAHEARGCGPARGPVFHLERYMVGLRLVVEVLPGQKLRERLAGASAQRLGCGRGGRAVEQVWRELFHDGAIVERVGALLSITNLI